MSTLRTERGFTLVELLVAMPMLLILLAGLTSTLIQLVHSNDNTQQRATLQTEARAAVATLETDIRGAFTGDGTPPIITATANSITLETPDRSPTVTTGQSQTSFHLRKITYAVSSGTLQNQSMTSINTFPTAPAWTWPGSMGSWASMVGSVTNTDVFSYYTSAGVQASPPTPLAFPINDTTGITAVGVKLTVATTGQNPEPYTTNEIVYIRTNA